MCPKEEEYHVLQSCVPDAVYITLLPMSITKSISRMEDDEQSSLEFEDDEDGYSTPSAVLKKMTTCWQNELCVPCLLPTQIDFVEILLDQIAGMEEDINKQTNKMQLRISVHRMELQRISFITSDYLRCRLQKIEKNPNSVLQEHRKREQEGASDLLSKDELIFAQEYASLEAELFSNTALGELLHTQSTYIVMFSETLRVGLKKLAMPEANQKQDMVYAQVVAEDVGSVSIPDWTDLNSEVILEMEQFSVHLIPFNSIKHNVEQGKMILL